MNSPDTINTANMPPTMPPTRCNSCAIFIYPKAQVGGRRPPAGGYWPLWGQSAWCWPCAGGDTGSGVTGAGKPCNGN